jgi:hypothetical protein
MPTEEPDINPILRRLSPWVAPFVGGLLISSYLTARGWPVFLTIPNPREEAVSSFIDWFIFDSLANLICGLPLLFIARWLGLKTTLGFMLLASVAVIPYAASTSTPTDFWHPTDEELDHGFYWDAFLPWVILASATGWVFSRTIRHEPATAETASGKLSLLEGPRK